MDRERLLEDLRKAVRSKNFVEYFQKYNFRVEDPQYLNPVVIKGEVLPINHSDGLFMYFQRIVEVLQITLCGGAIFLEELPANAPKYLEELAR